MPIYLPPADDQKALKALISRRHPGYQDNLEHWRFCDQCYEGGRDWFRDNIFRYIKEGDIEFSDRVRRAYRFNHTREVVQLVTKYIFKQQVLRNATDVPERVALFWRNATRQGQEIDALMRRVCDLSSLHGRAWIFVDALAPDASPITLADERASGATIYAMALPTSEVLDFARDERGQLIWALLRIWKRDDTDPVLSSGQVEPQYLLIARDEWVRLAERPVARAARKKEVVVLERGVNAVGEVPLVAVDHIETDDAWAPPSLVGDIAYLDRAAANYLSNLDAIIQDQTFSQLVMPAQGVTPGSDEHSKMMEMGTKRVFLYDSEAGSPPAYISPDAKQPQIILETVNKIVSEIYHSVGMAGERTKQDNAMGIDNSSGVAKAYDFERMNALLAAKAAILDRAENEVARLVCRFAGEEPAPMDDRRVRYPQSFDVRGLYDEFDIAERLARVNGPRRLRRKQMETLADKLMPVIPDAERGEIMADMREWPPEAPAPMPGAAPPGESRQGQNTGQNDPKAIA